MVSSWRVCWLDISLCGLEVVELSTNKSFAADNGLQVVFNSKNIPDGISVLCHDDKFGNGVNSLVSVLIFKTIFF